jgi:hypothetical protein
MIRIYIFRGTNMRDLDEGALRWGPPAPSAPDQRGLKAPDQRDP